MQRSPEDSFSGFSIDLLENARCRKVAKTTVPYRYVRPYTTCFVGMAYASTRRVKLRLRRIENISTFKMLVISPLDTPHFPRIGHWHMAS